MRQRFSIAQHPMSPASLATFEGQPTRRVFLSWLVAACVSSAAPIGSLTMEPAVANELSDQTILTLLAIAQPACVDEVVQLAADAFPAVDAPTTAYCNLLLQHYEACGIVMQVRHEPLPLFSLTASGQASLPLESRLLRDRARLFLLRGHIRCRVRFSRGQHVRGAGDPPANSLRIDTERLNTKLSVRDLADVRSGNRRPRENLPRLLSFDDIEQVKKALGDSATAPGLSYQGIALCLGISSQLLDWFVDHPDRSYREFTIPKRKGGVRRIASPRVFLKVTQRLVLDFFLDHLRVHPAVHSFRRGYSSVSNAIVHERQRVVGRLDIKDFFGSVTPEMIARCLTDNGFDADCADKLARLCTRNGVLPQGAPTSPALSNTLLYPFDQIMEVECAASGLRYTRYADDVTVSGDQVAIVAAALSRAEAELQHRFGFRVNQAKTRIAGAGTQQRVTGIVVNQSAKPPRSLCRQLRATFHEAAKDPSAHVVIAQRLAGYISYLQAFPSLRSSSDLAEYKTVLAKIRLSDSHRYLISAGDGGRRATA